MILGQAAVGGDAGLLRRKRREVPCYTLKGNQVFTLLTGSVATVLEGEGVIATSLDR